LPCFDIVKNVVVDDKPSFRVSAILSAFSLDPKAINEHFQGNIDIEDKEWSIGLIVGASGTGKSTIAKELFPNEYIDHYVYGNGPIVDEMPQGQSVKDIEKVFTSVGFASPPSWLKEYSVLSNGERMRVDLARAILEQRDIIVFDEFTSVVDRDVAKTTSYALSKAIRKLGKKFIAVSCHRDIIDWLGPDWVYDTDEKLFSFQEGGMTAQTSNSIYMNSQTSQNITFGRFLGGIII